MSSNCKVNILEVEVHMVTEKEKLQEQVCEVLKTLRPNWKSSDITVSDPSGGCLNKVYLISSADHPDDPIAMKVYGEGVMYMMDHNELYHVLEYVHEHTDILTLYCRFQNGLMYEFFPGDLMSISDYENDIVKRKVCEKLHELHAVPLPQRMKTGGSEHYDFTQSMVERALKELQSEKGAMLDKNEALRSIGMSRADVIEGALQTIKAHEALREKYPNVHCHGDPKMENIVVKKQTGEVNLIDWDLMGVHVEIMDLALAATRDTDWQIERAHMQPFQDDEKQLNGWLTAYLDTHPKLQGKTITPEVFKQWKKLLLIASEVTSKTGGLLCLGIFIVFGETQIDGASLFVHYWSLGEKYKEMYKKMGDVGTPILPECAREPSSNTN